MREKLASCWRLVYSLTFCSNRLSANGEVVRSGYGWNTFSLRRPKEKLRRRVA
jgi:hypothetical protein